ncbi:CO/xanthine dehydrogenase Mo-binding subunit [Catenulispora sp. MAP5-51]|uniref:xanthine dehydrogenase family protein molybdopterin-binding subunit n=1 Tax=Catenulispora sp. MAP5-51 TaxID=3156298 RepID=UPI0035180221
MTEPKFPADLRAEGMLWMGATRSPHASAAIRGLDMRAARAIPGVHAVLSAADLPGYNFHGPRSIDQPVLAADVARYIGEPVVVVAAEHPALARAAAEKVRVVWDPLRPLHDPDQAAAAAPIHPDGNVLHSTTLAFGTEPATLADPASAASAGRKVIEGEYVLDAVPVRPAAPAVVIAVPNGERGIEIYVATVSPRGDREVVAQCLGLPVEKVHVIPTRVGGADTHREDVGLQVQAALLAMATGRPVKAVVPRDAPAHPGRPAAQLRYRHVVADDGALVAVEADILLDGGAYASTTIDILDEACRLAVGPYRVPNVRVTGRVVRTNNPPAGRVRGGGGALTCAAYEAQMDAAGSAVGLGGLEIRLRNLLRPGDLVPDAGDPLGKPAAAPVPIPDCLHEVLDTPMPSFPPGPDIREYPGTVGRTGELTRIRRGVGVALGMADLSNPTQLGEYATAVVLVSMSPDGPAATVACSAVETGSGLHDLIRVSVERTLGIPADRVAVRAPEDPGSLPSSSAVTHPAWVHGSAVETAAKQVRAKLFQALAEQIGIDGGLLKVVDGYLVSHDDVFHLPLDDAYRQCLPAGRVVRGDGEFRMLTMPTLTGTSDAASVAVGAVRAVVDVDTELGLVNVVQVAIAQDAGRVAVRERAEHRVASGAVAGAGFVLSEGADLPFGWGEPSAMDAPEVVVAALLETAEEAKEEIGPDGLPVAAPPLGGMKPVGDLSVMATPAAVLAAIRDAVGDPREGSPLRLPLRPDRAWWVLA